MSRDETAAGFTQAALQAHGRIDILLNNAAISVVKALHEHTPDEWDSVLDINVKAIYLAARHVIPVMICQKSGLVLNTGSISGVAGITLQGAYAASKGALHQMTRQMAIDYAAHGIRVNAVGVARWIRRSFTARPLLRPTLTGSGRALRGGIRSGGSPGRMKSRRFSRTWRATMPRSLRARC